MRKIQAHHWPLGVFFIVTLVFTDQISKWWVTEHLLRYNAGLDFFSWLAAAPERLPYTEKTISGFFNVVMVWNEGISFGMFTSQSAVTTLAITVLTSLVALIFFIWMVRTENRGLAAALSLIIGGALGNIIDRTRFGAVIDFLDFHLFNTHWPAFNIADTSIVLGILFILYDSLFTVKKTKRKKRIVENKNHEKNT